MSWQDVQELWIFHCHAVAVVIYHEVVGGFDAVFLDCAVECSVPWEVFDGEREWMW